MSRVQGRGPQRDAKQTEAAEAERAAATEVLQVLRAREPKGGIELSLDAIASVVEVMGAPQTAFPSIHVTGTNGKTSTARMIEALLREHGLRTGRFTSPELLDVRDEIALDGEPISWGALAAALHDVLPLVELVENGPEGLTVSAFELLVLMALAAFADRPVDVAVIEVGMGGARDATNVVDAGISVVTPIARDHERYLGTELVDIAAEKAGIIKPGGLAVLGEQRPEVDDVLRDRAEAVGARGIVVDGRDAGVVSRAVALGGQVVSLQTPHAVYTDVFLPLYGEHQAHNAVLALTAAEAFLAGDGGGLDPDTVREAFAGVTSPGRLEIVRRGPTVVIDAAHNPAGAEALTVAFREAFDFEFLVGVVAVLEGKDAEGILGALEPLLAEIVITRTSSRRSMDVDDLGDIARDVFGEDRVHIVGDLLSAVDAAIGLAEAGGRMGGGVLATGTVTMAGDVRRLMGPTMRGAG